MIQLNCVHCQWKCDLYFSRLIISLIDIYYFIHEKKEFTVNGASISFDFIWFHFGVLCVSQSVYLLACSPKRLHSSDYRSNFQRHVLIFLQRLIFPSKAHTLTLTHIVAGTIRLWCWSPIFTMNKYVARPGTTGWSHYLWMRDFLAHRNLQNDFHIKLAN